MAAMGRMALYLTVAARAAAHGAMYEPPPRNSAGMSLLSPGCPGGACQWYNQGCNIGCPEITGQHGTDDVCAKPAEPTLNWGEDDEFLQYKDDGFGGDTKYHPWRYPGSAPVADSCGITGGARAPLGQWDPPPGFKTGVDGSNHGTLPVLLDKTVWRPGSQVEVAWGIAANHGGGYQYRLCPALQAPKEACFQKTPLKFVGDKQWLQFGDGFDRNQRIEITARRVGGKKVVPEGSTWTMNPIPGCKGNGGRARAECLGPTFEPAPGGNKMYRYGGESAPGIYGYGSGRCMGNLSTTPSAKCTLEEYYNVSFDFGIVDLVEIPADLPEGDYVLSWRWDCEMTKQIWSSCADVTIKQADKTTPAFSKGAECSACCPGGLCAHCAGCLEDKTGDCAKCWEPMPWWNGRTWWTPRAKAVQCLGGVNSYRPGDPLEPAWSPGCEKCWSNPDGCKATVRGVDNAAVIASPPSGLLFYSVVALAVIAAAIGVLLIVKSCRKHSVRDTSDAANVEMRVT